MSAAMVVLFPLGAILMRIGAGVWVHAAVQATTLISVIAGFGLGVKLAQRTDLVSLYFWQ
jgi:hypothetical protein